MSADTAGARELISIRVGEQMFALDIMKVREIRGWTASTPLPHAPSYVLGMINLRGTVLPVLDLSGRLGLPPRTPDASSVVVVAELAGRPVGLLVDAVCDIITVDAAQIQAAPDLGSGDTDFVRGVITLETEIVTLLDLDTALPETALAA
ncbi:chemotaxis protein CheW [Phenylobacterium sp. J367]|uniref:chemotaxis protein CheW n=1 Tax=Phenylobacterium sp. J367 TaxID=2898435 RepID=UPI0021518B4D|nr:chemotaxis protein CheW [Phenylobacterium sp. J367]MCR5879029.1 chemotaxis protein CheW [Phenylobacterium sp. J367]